jgi:Ca2+-binding EF-hand superfamily protein
MLRRLSGILFLGAMLFTGMLLAQERGTLGRPEANQRPPAKSAAPLPFDVDDFLRTFDLNKDGFLDRNEVPPFVRENFDRLDLNKDGKLSRDELIQGAALLQPRRRPSDVAFALIEMGNGDSESVAELQRLYDVLRRLDRNKDGKIDPEAVKSARANLIEDRVDQTFKDLDTNKDGKISREEARGLLRRNFEQIDKNGDGFIDRNELREAMMAGPPPGAAPRPLPAGARK